MKWARIYLFDSKIPQFLLSIGYYFHADKLVNALELVFDYIVFLIRFFLLEVCLSCINSIPLSLFCGQPDEPVLEDEDDDDEDDDDDDKDDDEVEGKFTVNVVCCSIYVSFFFFFFPCVYAFTSIPVKSMGIFSNHTLSLNKNLVKGEVRLQEGSLVGYNG